MKYEILLIDLDDTIFDFKLAERVAIAKTLREFGVEPTDEIIHRYHVVNKWHWEQMELGKLTRQEVLENRFAVLFSELGVSVDKAACAKAYGANLAVGHYYLPGAEEALQALQGKYRLFLASNGTAWVQRSRMDSADLERFFEDIFISQEIGANKPAPAYFEGCFSKIPGFDKDKTMIVGDSLSSDILGGNNAGITTCWVNPDRKTHGPDLRVDYEIQSLAQLPGLLESL